MTFISKKNYGFNLEIDLMDDITTIYASTNTLMKSIFQSYVLARKIWTTAFKHRSYILSLVS